MARLSKLSQAVALAFGMELRGEFKGDQRRETARRWTTADCVPESAGWVKQVAHLLDGSGRGGGCGGELETPAFGESVFHPPLLTNTPPGCLSFASLLLLLLP